MTRIAVIGTGLAGLACAARLAAAGLDVCVFEKSRGTGGRLNTRRDHGTAFDQGAQYFTARDPRFLRQVEAWEAAGVVARWQVEPGLIEAGGRLLPSPDDTPRYVGVPGMSTLAQQLAGRDMALCTETLVSTLRRQGRRWVLQAGERVLPGEFDGVVVAVPAPQALPLVDASPSLALAARGAVMEPCWSVAIGFAEPTGIAFNAAFAVGQPVSWLARNSAKPGRAPVPETWVLHAAPSWSEEHLESPPAAVARHLRRWFVETVAPASEPDWLHAHRWRFARAARAIPGGHAWDGLLQLGLCGDWCAGGRVEGAWLSGLALAETILAETPPAPRR